MDNRGKKPFYCEKVHGFTVCGNEVCIQKLFDLSCELSKFFKTFPARIREKTRKKDLCLIFYLFLVVSHNL